MQKITSNAVLSCALSLLFSILDHHTPRKPHSLRTCTPASAESAGRSSNPGPRPPYDGSARGDESWMPTMPAHHRPAWAVGRGRHSGLVRVEPPPRPWLGDCRSFKQPPTAETRSPPRLGSGWPQGPGRHSGREPSRGRGCAVPAAELATPRDARAGDVMPALGT
jgi:hypothetical protein